MTDTETKPTYHVDLSVYAETERSNSEHESVITLQQTEAVGQDVEKQTVLASDEQDESPPPPDGGLLAWMQVVASIGVMICAWGLVNSFGVFQSYYATEYLPDASDSSISWIGTLQTCLILGGVMWSGVLIDLGYGYLTILAGVVLIIFGMFMTSLSREYWQLVLAQGLVVGVGMGSAFAPTTAIITSYFDKKRGLALGAISIGSNFGGMIFPIAFGRLVDRIGFAWTCRAFAFIMLALLALPALIIRQRIKPATISRLCDFKALKEADFTLYGISLFVSYLGCFVPFFYIQLYAIEEDIITGDLNFYLLPILNVGGFFGGLMIGHLADKIGALNTYSLSCLTCAILQFGWIGIHNKAGVIWFVLLYGFFSSGPIVLPYAVTATNLTPDMRHFGVRLTMQLVPSALGALIGNPIAGVLLPYGWLGLQLFGALTILAGGMISYAARCCNGGTKLLRKL